MGLESDRDHLVVSCLCHQQLDESARHDKPSADRSRVARITLGARVRRRLGNCN